MPQLIVTTREGETRALTATPGATIMETIRDAGIDQMQALCGGACSCATCHIYVDPAFNDLLPKISADEDELLNGTTHRNDKSRLSCQIRLTDSLSGLRIMIAGED